MRVAVMAAGGIGGYYGGLLAQAGHEVTFVARGEHLRAIQERGLHVKSIDDEFLILPARATDDVKEIGPVDLVLFSVKTYDTNEAAQLCKPLIAEHSCLVTFQNGVEEMDRIGAVLGPDHVTAAPTQIESFIAAPGHFEQKSNFRVVTFAESDVESRPQIKMLAEVFRQRHFQVSIVSDMRRALWLKFLRLAPVAGLASLARTAPAELWRVDFASEVLDLAIREVVAVGCAEGVNLDESDFAAAREWGLNLKPGLKPSMQKDVERGNRLEIDALSGAVARLGKKHGVPTPVHETIYAGLKPVDEQNRLAKDAREVQLFNQAR